MGGKKGEEVKEKKNFGTLIQIHIYLTNTSLHVLKLTLSETFHLLSLWIRRNSQLFFLTKHIDDIIHGI